MRACRGSLRAPAAQRPAAWCTHKDLRHVRTWQAGWITQRNVGARWHTDGTQSARRWRAPTQDLARANSSVGARQVLSWRASSGKLARQLPIWRAPTPLLARAKSGVGAPTYHLARAKAMPSQCLLISSTACCPDSDSPRPLPPACAPGQAGAQPGACPAGLVEGAVVQTGLCAQRRPDCSLLGQKLGGHHRNTVRQLRYTLRLHGRHARPVAHRCKRDKQYPARPAPRWITVPRRSVTLRSGWITISHRFAA